MDTQLALHLAWPVQGRARGRGAGVGAMRRGTRRAVAGGIRALQPTTLIANPAPRSAGARGLMIGAARETAPTAVGAIRGARGHVRGLRRLVRGRMHVVPPFRAAKGLRAF